MLWKAKKALDISQIKSAKEIWQLNAISDPSLAPVVEGEKSFSQRTLLGKLTKLEYEE